MNVMTEATTCANKADRECVQQVERLQAHRHTIRQAGAQLSGLRLPRRRARMVDLMSPDPSPGFPLARERAEEIPAHPGRTSATRKLRRTCLRRSAPYGP